MPELSGRLENITFLPVVQRYFRHIIERETPQVHLSVLRIADLYSIDQHSRMVGTQGSDIHGLQSADSAVILDLYTGEKAHCVSNRKGIQPLKFLSAKGLRGYSLPVSKAGSISQYH